MNTLKKLLSLLLCGVMLFSLMSLVGCAKDEPLKLGLGVVSYVEKVTNADADTVRLMYDLYRKGWSMMAIARYTGLKYERLAEQILRRKTNACYIVYNLSINVAKASVNV